MRFKRMIAALLSAAIYMTAGAAAAELPQDAAEAETTAVTTRDCRRAGSDTGSAAGGEQSSARQRPRTRFSSTARR